MMMLYALVAVCALSGVLCDESTEIIDCSKIKVQENFNFSKVVGRWYIAQGSGDCTRINDEEWIYEGITVDFQLDEDKSKKLIMTATFKSLTDEAQGNLTIPMVLVDESTNPAKFNLTSNVFTAIRNRPGLLVGTDYETYVIILNCDEMYKNTVALILVKDKGLVGETVSRASAVAKKRGLNSEFVPFICPE